MTLNLNALHAAATAAVDMTKATQGGTYEAPAKGQGTAVLVGYIEVGKQTRKIKGVNTVEDQAILRFELTGPLWPAKDVDGVKIPHVIDVKLKRSLNEKANFFKLFNRMNYLGKATHFSHLLGQTFKVKVNHREAKVGDKTMTFADLNNKEEGFTIYPPRIEIVNEETGVTQVKDMKVNPHITALHALLWDTPSLDQWKSIFIEGEFKAETNDAGEVTKPARSKNKYQLLAAGATNYQGSALHAMLTGEGVVLDIPAPGENIDDDETEAEAPPPAKPAQVSAANAATSDDALSDIQ
jgi:hypothetical protein